MHPEPVTFLSREDTTATPRARAQAHFDRAYELLAAMEERTSAAERDAAQRAAGDWDATMARLHLRQRLASIQDDSSPLCFGRIQEDPGAGGNEWHVGRRHVEDRAGEPVVIDWRATKAVPYYRATYADPVGLRSRDRFLLTRRKVQDVLEEDFTDPGSAGAAAGAGLPDPLLATLGHARSGTMRDIVATIASEQDRIIRAPIDQAVVVQGGPGTGKTAVGLHRAAFLLYEHRARLEHQGVLVIGPNKVFLAYISEVLPSLGETAVTQTTLAGLVPQWPVRAEETAQRAGLKGDPRMADLVAGAADALLHRARSDLRASTRWGVATISAPRLDEILDAARGSGGTFADRRARFRRAVVTEVTRGLREKRSETIDGGNVAADLGADRMVEGALGAMWPSVSPLSLVRRMYSNPGKLAASILGGDGADLLARRPSRSLRDERWTEADLPILDEASAVVSVVQRTYGHVVVDEAQDLSAMALRMLARRCKDRRSYTVLGDLAQATAPGATGDWRRTLHALGDPQGAAIAPLSVGYRVPEAIMRVANDYLAHNAPHLEPTGSVRRDGDRPVFTAVVREDDLDAAVVAATGELRSRYQSVAVIGPHGVLDRVARALGDAGVPSDGPGTAPRSGRVSCVYAKDAKGLEFDAVVVVEPQQIAAGPGGVGLLYIAMTRAVQHLSLLHSGPLPDGLAASEAA